VVACDDHDLFRRGVVEMLSVAGEGIEVVGEARTHEGAVAAVLEGRPDVVLLDLEMPGAMGADEAMGRMLGLSPPPGVVVFTMHDEPGMVRRFLGRGATAHLAKSALTEELAAAVRSAARVATGGSPGEGADAMPAPEDAPEGLPEAAEGARRGR
jgi:DNA-binding NarL/FixJ family response regulator